MLYNTLYAVMTVVESVQATGGFIVMCFVVSTLVVMFDNAQKEF
jgi:p-aminobenzoyl-glutamate transporter AbgT